VGPLFRFLLSKDHILEVSGAYTRKNFFKAVANPELEDQTLQGAGQLDRWIWLFGENAMLNLRFGYTKDDAEGLHYDNQDTAHR